MVFGLITKSNITLQSVRSAILLCGVRQSIDGGDVNCQSVHNAYRYVWFRYSGDNKDYYQSVGILLFVFLVC